MKDESSLDKSVVYTGDFISANTVALSATNAPASAATFGTATRSHAPSNNASAPLQLRDVRLRGRAIIDLRNQLEINAHPLASAQ